MTIDWRSIGFNRKGAVHAVIAGAVVSVCYYAFNFAPCEPMDDKGAVHQYCVERLIRNAGYSCDIDSASAWWTKKGVAAYCNGRADKYDLAEDADGWKVRRAACYRTGDSGDAIADVLGMCNK